MSTSPFDYTLNYARIVVNRGSDVEIVHDVSKLMAEINVYESLSVPYLTGNMTIADSDSVSSIVNFNGTERLQLSVTVGSNTIEREFFITGMSNYQKTDSSEGAAVYTLDFVEPKAFKSNFVRLRRAYSGEIGELIRGIYASELDEQFVTLGKSVQDVSVIIPNLTPLEACLWLAKRATSEYGEPYFLYSTLIGGNYFKNLGDMMTDPVLEAPYKYSAAMMNKRDFETQSRAIISLSIPYPEDLTRIAKAGGVKSQYLSIDLLTKRVSDMTFDVATRHESKIQGNRLRDNTNLLFDKSFRIDEKHGIMDRESAFVTSVNTTRAFEKNSYSSESVPTQHLLKMGRNSDLLFLEKQRAIISVAGYTFLSRENEHMTVGTQIDVQIPKDQPVYNETDTSKILDTKRSGTYLITHCRHTFSATKKYTVSLGLGRPTGPDALNDTEEAAR